MRLLFAGLFVWLGFLVAPGVAGIVIPGNTPSWPPAALANVTCISLCLTALTEPIMSIVTMAQSTLSIRAATAADAEMLTGFARRTFHDAFASLNSPENMKAYMSQNFTPQKLSAQLADPRAIFLIAEIDAAPVAFAKLYDGDVPDCVSGHAPVEIERSYVDRRFHGQGAAQTLMQVCFDRARQLGHGTIYLGVWENNRRAIAFYRKCGFDVVGSHVFHMGDEAQNDLLMERSLQEPSQ